MGREGEEEEAAAKDNRCLAIHSACIFSRLDILHNASRAAFCVLLPSRKLFCSLNDELHSA